MSGDLEGQVLELPDVRITFGRAADNVIATNNPAVSSHHAALVPESGGFVLYDLNSSNGTFVNGQPIQQKRLLNGDRIRIGIMEMEYELEGAPVVERQAPPPPPEPEVKPVTKPVEPMRVVLEPPPAPVAKQEPARVEPLKFEPEEAEPKKVAVEPPPAPVIAKPSPPPVQPAPVVKAPEPVAPPPPAPAPPPAQPAPKPVAPVVVPPKVEPVAPSPAPPVKAAPVVEKPAPPVAPPAPAPAKTVPVVVAPTAPPPSKPPEVKLEPVVKAPEPITPPQPRQPEIAKEKPVDIPPPPPAPVKPVVVVPPPPAEAKPAPVIKAPEPIVPPAPVQPEVKVKPPEVAPAKPISVVVPPAPAVPPPAQKAPVRVELPSKEEKPKAPEVVLPKVEPPPQPVTPPGPTGKKVEPPGKVPAIIANFVPLSAATHPPVPPAKSPGVGTPAAPAGGTVPAPAKPIVVPPPAKVTLPPIERAAVPAPPVVAPITPAVPVKVVMTEILREQPRDLRKQFEILPPVNPSVFVQDAKQVVALRESNGQFVSFKSCWPAYDAMDAAQQRWYFYWRDVLRHEQYPTTDTAYIFLHAYELLNNVGVRNAADGFRQLHTLWLRYRGRHPRMDAYFVDWLADYVIVNPCGVDPLNIYFEAFELGGYAGNPDLLLNRVLATKEAPLPRRLLFALADYPLRYSRFYLDGNQKLLDEFVLKAFQAVDARLMETEGQGILEKFAPEATETIRRVPFEGALSPGHAEEIAVATVLPFSKSRRLRDFANAVVKHTENCFRELSGYGGRLQNYELSPDLRSTLSTYIGSNAAGLVKAQKGGTFLRVENCFSNQDTLRSILIRCSEEEKEGVRMAAEQGGAALPPETIERVNHLARRFLGDALLFCRQASWHVADEYHEDLKTVLAQRARTDAALWQKFLSHLSDTQRRILAGIATQKAFSDEIRQLAGSRGALETVFHSINDMARKTIGEDVIDTLAIPPRIHREDAELIQHLMAK